MCWENGQPCLHKKNMSFQRLCYFTLLFASYIYNNRAGNRRQRLKLFPTFNLVLLPVSLIYWLCLDAVSVSRCLHRDCNFIFSGNYFADIRFVVWQILCVNLGRSFHLIFIILHRDWSASLNVEHIFLQIWSIERIMKRKRAFRNDVDQIAFFLLLS